jgi:hypothetical protein
LFGGSPTTCEPLRPRRHARPGLAAPDSAGTASTENIEFAKRFTEEHRETFDRLAK